MKQITVRIDEKLHKLAKIKAIKNGETFTNYVANLIRKDMNLEKEKE